MRIAPAVITLPCLCLWACEPFDAQVVDNVEESAEETCCGELGSCVSELYLSSTVKQHLGHDRCLAPMLCVPTAWLQDPTSPPSSCRAAGDVEGRCLPACLPQVAARATELDQDRCAAAHLCVPCYDPATGEDTQACRVEPDPGPAEPPPG